MECVCITASGLKKQAGIPKKAAYKLTCGMLFFTYSFVCKMSPPDMKDSFLDFQTSRYKFHYYKTLTGIEGGHEY
ncbi:hypothetical protein E5288_WYG010892 [Bos mutus]|uniref:Trafficking protein particle complex subunit 1 n=1 Tax=Bos mutus TaxID=72004 RepID=L8HS73_9CETA|nr:Trafficking protein particle complex subunit 1 [Bos mutus]MXQ82348.1 hypothetical protein [Bos mutus]